MQRMRRCRPLAPPGQLPPPPGGWDPPPLDRRDDCAKARRWRSPATATTSMPEIYIGALFIWREDREGDDGSGVVTEDDDDTNAEAGGYAHDFLEVFLRRLWEGRFGRRRTTTKTIEMSRDDEHEEDVMMRSMFKTLCEGKLLLSLSTAHPKHRSSATTAARAAGQIRCGQNDHGRDEDDGDDRTGNASVTTTSTNDYHTYNDETTHISI